MNAITAIEMTAEEWIRVPQIERAYLTGDMPPGIAGLLPMEAEEAETVQDDGTRAD